MRSLLGQCFSFLFPHSAEVLRKRRFADDSFAGGDTLQETIHVRDELVKILASASMSVGKWAANHPSLLSGITAGEKSAKELSFSEGETVSTLGLRWIPVDDDFCFNISLPSPASSLSKRSMLSEISRLFDPIGWLAPVIIQAKLLLQNLWLQGLGWDDPIPTEIRKAWLYFREQLTQAELIRIPRWFGTFKSSVWQSHGFSDASERAYAAALYIVVPADNRFIAHLVAAKSKVAPVKVVSLPKLELCGATLLSLSFTGVFSAETSVTSGGHIDRLTLNLLKHRQENFFFLLIFQTETKCI